MCFNIAFNEFKSWPRLSSSYKTFIHIVLKSLSFASSMLFLFRPMASPILLDFLLLRFLFEVCFYQK